MATNYSDPAFKEWMNSNGKKVGWDKTSWDRAWNDYQNYKSSNSSRTQDILNGNPQNFSITGSNNEIAGRLEGLERAAMLTGQGPAQIGQDYQDAMGRVKKRADGTDTASELLRANKAGAVADAKNTLQAQGVKGGAALNAVSAVERAKSYDVNNQLVQAQKDAETQYLNAVKGNANFTTQMEMGFGQMAAGKDVKAPVNNSNGFGTVICTELYRKGYFSEAMWKADQEYGRKVRPEVYIGYRFWADSVVRKMQKSDKFTKAVAALAVPWAKNMAGERNLLGAFLSMVGEPICGLIGKILISLEGVRRAN